ncbi:MAG: phosphoribosyltransferase family protein [Planctomycetaceae bacterium]
MRQKVRTAVKNLLTAALDFALPWQCLLCQSTNHSAASPDNRRSFCQSCLELLAPEIENRCERCGAAVGAYVITSRGCVHCRKKPIRFDSVVCLSMYDDAIRKAILSGKWSHSTVIMEALAQLLADRRHAELHALRPQIVIPVPQSVPSRLTRHFNSATLIADVLARRLGVPVDHHILKRSRNSRPQKRVAVQQRFENQKDAFALNDAHLLKGMRVLLVDDVLTTGATCSEAARLLKKNRAASCPVAVIARVLDASA